MFLRRQIDGYMMDELVSALQKALRRSQVEGALYWGRVMYRNGYWNAAFNRLKVIVMEDVAGNLGLAQYIADQYLLGKKSLKNKSLTESKDIPICGEVLDRCIVALAKSPKSRCLNHWLGMTRLKLLDQDFSPPSTCLANLRTSILKDHKPDESLGWALRLHISGEDAELWKLLRKIEPKTAALYSFREQNASLAIAYSLAIIHKNDFPKHVAFKLEQVKPFPIPLPDSAQRLEIPDHALDKHTGRGKRMGRGIDHFMTVGALVNDELFSDPWADQVKQWYQDREDKGQKAKSGAIMEEIAAKWNISKKVKGEKRAREDSTDNPNKKRVKEPKGVKRARPSSTSEPSKRPKTSNVMPPAAVMQSVTEDPIGRLGAGMRYTQMPCGWKCGAVVGTDPVTGERVFVKGPESKVHVETQLFLNNVIKPQLAPLVHHPMIGLEFNGRYYIQTKDLSDLRRPTFQRQWKDKSIPILGSLPDAHSLTFKEYLEEHKGDWKAIPDSVRRQYLAIVIYRKIFGISDSNHRNFFTTRFPGEPIHIFSCDEMVFDKDMPSAEWIYSCSKEWIESLPAKFVEEREWIQALLADWAPHIPVDFQARFTRVKNRLSS